MLHPRATGYKSTIPVTGPEPHATLQPDKIRRTMARGAGGGRLTEQQLIQRFRGARRDPGLAALEGFHPLKHALRFGAEVLEIAVVDPERLARLAEELAPDIVQRLAQVPTLTVRPKTFEQLAPVPPREQIIAIAKRPAVSVDAVLDTPGPRPIVLLDDPTYHPNVGATVRVAAAADAAGLFVLGELDPWHSVALRGGAGLQFALPVTRIDELPPTDRPLVAIDPDGEPLPHAAIPPRAILAFGSERRGLSTAILEAADLRIGIPMRPGVSSLSLATAVAVTLYAWRGVVRAEESRQL